MAMQQIMSEDRRDHCQGPAQRAGGSALAAAGASGRAAAAARSVADPAAVATDADVPGR